MKLFKQAPVWDENESVTKYRNRMQKKIFIERTVIFLAILAGIALVFLLGKVLSTDISAGDTPPRFSNQALAEIQELQSQIAQDKDAYKELELKLREIHDSAEQKREKLNGLCAYLGT